MSSGGQRGASAPASRNAGILRFVPDSDKVLARMDRSTVQVFSSLRDYVESYGPFVDRLGLPSGKYLWQLPVDGKAFSFEERALEVPALKDPYYRFEVKALPEGFFIRTGINVPQFNLPGGARQVQFMAGDYVLTVSECLQLGILVGKAQG